MSDVDITVLACLAELDPTGDGIPDVCRMCDVKVIISPYTMENLNGRTYDCICEKCVLEHDLISQATKIELPSLDQMKELAKRILRRN